MRGKHLFIFFKKRIERWEGQGYHSLGFFHVRLKRIASSPIHIIFKGLKSHDNLNYIHYHLSSLSWVKSLFEPLEQACLIELVSSNVTNAHLVGVKHFFLSTSLKYIYEVYPTNDNPNCVLSKWNHKILGKSSIKSIIHYVDTMYIHAD